MNASIRSSLLLALLLLPACAAGTPRGDTAPRPLRESMVLLDESASRGPASLPIHEMRPREPERTRVVWKVNAVR